MAYARRLGVPRGGYERLVNHLGKAEADRLVGIYGLEEAVRRFLPTRGARVTASSSGLEWVLVIAGVGLALLGAAMMWGR